MVYPEMFAVRQTFSRDREMDVPGAVGRELRRIFAHTTVRAGARVAITAGSRGIRDLAVIIRAVVDDLKSRGALPFIFPAMGSHGGGTAEGQAAVLCHYGLTEEAMGCPILSSMDCCRIGESKERLPIFLDRYASEADHVVAINRIKEHTEFKGEIESGLMKMMLIGMGKQDGARVYHKAFADFGFGCIVESLAHVVVERAKILFAIAIIENGYEETALVRGLLPNEIVASERALLQKAKVLAPRLPFDDIDIAVVDEMGKNISGAGMDTNVIGRFYNQVASEPVKPHIKRIYVRSLTEQSMGNAIGIGLADFVHRSVVERMDACATHNNALTASNPEKARIPIVCDSDREALDFCFNTIGLTPPEEVRMIRIRNTLNLTEIDISSRLAKQAALRSDLEVLAGPVRLAFDAAGELLPMLSGGRHQEGV
jgi:hypothetical protein